ncbi:MAG: outer membrane protein transport protein [Myxococcota bacterium]
MLIGGGVGLGAAPAHASGLSTARFGGERGTPMDVNATSIFYNPGALGMLSGVDLFLDVNVAWRTANYERAAPPGCGRGADASTCTVPQEVPEPIDAPPGGNNGTASLFNVAAAPMVGAAAGGNISEDVRLAGGLSFFVPFGGQSSWDGNDDFRDNPRYPGPVDGVQRWYSIDGVLRALYASAAFAVGFSDYVSVGISGGVAITQVQTVRARVLDGSNSIPLEGRTLIDTSSLDAHLGGGVLVTPFGNQDLRIGLSYQAPTGFSGAITDGTLSTRNAGSTEENVNEVDFQVNWPDIIRLGVGWRASQRWELRLFGDFTRWSLFQDNCLVNTERVWANQTCQINDDGTVDTSGGDNIDSNDVIVNIPRRWNDAFAIRAGASYWVIPEVELQLGVGYDSNAIPDRTLGPDLLDFHDISLALGGKFQLIEGLFASLAYTQFFYIPRDTTGSSETNLFASPSAQPSAAGNYSQNIGVINAYLQAQFDPFSN